MENIKIKIDTKRRAVEEAEQAYKDLMNEAKRNGSAAAKYVS